MDSQDSNVTPLSASQMDPNHLFSSPESNQQQLTQESTGMSSVSSVDLQIPPGMRLVWEDAQEVNPPPITPKAVSRVEYDALVLVIHNIELEVKALKQEHRELQQSFNQQSLLLEEMRAQMSQQQMSQLDEYNEMQGDEI